MGCYDRFWLSTDMINMGNIFGYCHEDCMEFYGIMIDKAKFLEAFMRSNIRKEMENGQETLLTYASRIVVKKFIEVDNNGNYKQFKGKYNDKFTNRDWYWVGETYAYIHYMTEKTSRKMVELLPIDEMIKMYEIGKNKEKEEFYRWLVMQGMIFRRKQIK